MKPKVSSINWRNVGTLFIVLIAPVLLILLVKTGTTILKELPYLGGKVWNQSDSIFYKPNLDVLNLPSHLQGNHLIIYFNDGSIKSLMEDASENLDRISRRLIEVNDVKLIEIFQSDSIYFQTDSSNVRFKIGCKYNLDSLVSQEFQKGLDFQKTRLMINYAT